MPRDFAQFRRRFQFSASEHVRFLSNSLQLTRPTVRLGTTSDRLLTRLLTDGKWNRGRWDPRCSNTFENPNLPVTCSWTQFWFATAAITIFIYFIYLFTTIGLSSGGSGYFTCKQNMKLVTTRFKSGGLHEKHVVATWNVGNHLSICL